MLITRALGSWVFLAHVVTTLELTPDAPDLRSCGSCRLCIDACPTDAITEPYQLDPRRCIAYLTIEQEGRMDPELRSKTAGWIFGCDICQEVCPHNTRIPKATLTEFSRNPALDALGLRDILSLRSDEEFRARFHGTPFLRAGREGLIRNACVAAGVLKRTDLRPSLSDLCEPSQPPVVREHAQWALDQLNYCSNLS